MADPSTAIKIAFVVFGLGFLFFLFGFSSPYWHLMEWVDHGHPRTTYYGLWKHCQEQARYRSLPYDFCFSLISGDYARDYIRAAQFFETVGFLTALVSLIILLLSICIGSCQNRRILPILSAITAFAAAGCIILGCIIFGAKDEEKNNLSWAFALTLVGGILFAIVGVIVLVFSVIKKGTTESV
ncbi:uncharacterized protein [Littorina saxatilis]|uniref:Uncharacterized protein n=1 Tax=Littorina saxatilis TaxID=31220 RepID=A0AAN9G1P7_9CAEN